ncbi:MAG: 2-succinyl-5-enolpyruvyl-6-hydroxy-3-cyclohexene-1-carboxylic-acid synthase [bacterium]|nr:2-succinyl-5-enolpyruvyl-6-hydroxy-3-cyclohexene-1-carboxylic-acid synthase [bacterium]MXZ79183.1 2-succinyl-5-enolpyruvyl-6-hydroxy-3-cyclohexene-1-carboxylic-acid synthase [Acidimicrobiia bacterium]MYE72759.1 2-succinyl-5-enolpyruvyl-6-hydroxy-3-cyclohexene-1-carboxylic-acid synthase [Acidimicrobiia bacterium]MYJ61872.1 2-succinyl-5-enolpyruvyl-6-hydroxy-3-cyclohexene-1-carboxylic-acid synthase [Acidimicrobiia bacterium]
MTDLAYRATGRFWAELAACGIADVVVSPGSRSTPLAVTARNQEGLRVTVQLDERVAGFCALGMAKASGRPVAVVCTSGTAAANLFPAVVEAHHSGVPLVVCTADRPPELRDAGAGQTIDQVKLYGDHVRWYAETPCDLDDSDYFARLAVRAATAAGAGPNLGPVHLNWPFRKPLEPQGPIPRFDASVGQPIAPVRTLVEADVDAVRQMAGRRGLIVSGALDVDDGGAAAIVAFAETAGWPVVADAGSQLRGRGPMVLDGAEWVLRRTDLAPDVLVRIGGPPSNRAVIEFVESCTASDRLLVDPRRRWEDPSFGWTAALASDPVALLGAAAGQMASADDAWAVSWTEAAADAWDRVEAVLDGLGRVRPVKNAFGHTIEITDSWGLLEPLLAATLLRALPPEVALYASSSMPVRDVTSFWPSDALPRRVLVNRGANGIDGVVSSALGAALAIGQPVAALVGDVALLHDIGGLLAASLSGADLTVVVPNNDGGGIFSLLPLADGGSDVYFEELFHTPHGVLLGDLANGLGIHYHQIEQADELAVAIAKASGVTVIEVPIDHGAALKQRQQLSDLTE